MRLPWNYGIQKKKIKTVTFRYFHNIQQVMDKYRARGGLVTQQ